MRFRSFGALGGLTPIASLLPTAALLCSVGAADPDSIVTTAFSTALHNPAATAGAPSRQDDGIAGTEEYWLKSSRSGAVSPAFLVEDVSPGDRLTLTSSVGRQVLEVVSIEDPSAGSATRIDTSDWTTRHLVVVCRDTANPAALLYRFRIGTDGLAIRAGEPSTRVKERAL